MQHFIKRLFLKIYILNHKYLHRDDYLVRSDYEKEAVKICRNLITKNADTDLRIAPKSGKRHIKNNTLKMCVFINENSVDIIKNNYPQNIPISVKSHQTILNMFDGHAEQCRDNEELEVRSTLKYSIESILLETKNEKKK